MELKSFHSSPSHCEIILDSRIEYNLKNDADWFALPVDFIVGKRCKSLGKLQKEDYGIGRGGEKGMETFVKFVFLHICKYKGKIHFKVS